MTEIVSPMFKREYFNVEIESQQRQFTRSPLILTANEWNNYTIVNIEPPNLGVTSAEVRMNNEEQFKQELKFAIHLCNQGTISIALDNNDPIALGKCLKEVLALSSRQIECSIIVKVSMKDPKSFQTNYTSDGTDDEVEEEDQWKLFRKFYEATDCNPKIEVALVMTSDLPSEEEICRWFGECISLVIIPSYCFVSNAKNYPTLPPAHKKAFIHLVKLTKCHVCVEPKGELADHLIPTYAEFIKFVYNNSIMCENDNSGFEDNLRFPLQPMKDDLDTSTYEVFERDPAKYQLYQNAIEAAVLDKVPDDEIDTKTLIVMIVGAGRGPLVRATINVRIRTKRKIKIIVVEKNQNAIVTLSSMMQHYWKEDDITLISQDMRLMKLEEKADIIVSELLGSFGDNELSPECLDGAQQHLKPDGISIPCDSVTYLRPVMTMRNLQQVLSKNRNLVKEKSLYHPLIEVNWLVFLSSVYYIDQPKELWRFDHPNLSEVIDNQRNSKLNFTSKIDSVLHGFAGYFTSKLYKDIEISILPSSHTQGIQCYFSVHPCISKLEKLSTLNSQDLLINHSKFGTNGKLMMEKSLMKMVSFFLYIYKI